MPSAVHYHFTQKFSANAKKAFEWCTNYDPGDHFLMGEENAERKIKRLSKSTVILKDTFQTKTGRVEKKKLVQIYPDQLFWTATHLTGPVKYSQFLYKITPEENGSKLDFTGLYLDYENQNLNESENKKLAQQLCKEDAEAWKLLAKSMTKELCK